MIGRGQNFVFMLLCSTWGTFIFHLYMHESDETGVAQAHAVREVVTLSEGRGSLIHLVGGGAIWTNNSLDVADESWFQEVADLAFRTILLLQEQRTFISLYEAAMASKGAIRSTLLMETSLEGDVTEIRANQLTDAGASQSRIEAHELELITRLYEAYRKLAQLGVYAVRSGHYSFSPTTQVRDADSEGNAVKAVLLREAQTRLACNADGLNAYETAEGTGFSVDQISPSRGMAA